MKIRFIINGLGVVLLFLSLLFSCSKENSIKIEVLNVKAYKELFYPLPFGGAQDYGYVVTDSEGNRFHISNIEGFDEQYEEGFEYMIKVFVRHISPDCKNCPDALGYDEYTLVEIISKKCKCES